jgi:hypothetical protein
MDWFAARLRILIPILVLIPAIGLTAPAEWHARVGTDLIGEQFRLVDTDTLDLTTDYRAQLQTTWQSGDDTSSHVYVDNRIGMGTLAARHDLEIGGAMRLNRAWRLDLDAFTAARYYLDESSGTRSHFTEGRTNVVTRYGVPGSPVAWSLDQGASGIVYSGNSNYYLNALRHWHGIGTELRDGFDYGAARLLGIREVVPDSAGMGYWGVSVDGYTMRSLTSDWDMSSDLIATWRRYADSDTHPDQTDTYGSIRVDRRFNTAWSMQVSSDISATAYSPADSIYYTVYAVKPTLTAAWWPSWGQIRSGPSMAFQRSPTLAGENYRQWGGLVGFNGYSSRWGFIDASITIGHRDYLHDDEAFFSDYLYWDGTLALTAHLPWNIELDTFIILRNESHREAADNSASVLLTVDISRRIR